MLANTPKESRRSKDASVFANSLISSISVYDNSASRTKVDLHQDIYRLELRLMRPGRTYIYVVGVDTSEGDAGFS